MKVELLTRTGCHLCETARTLLESYGFDVLVTDIDLDESLRTKFTNVVPVVLFDGVERFRGQVNEVLLRRLLLEPKRQTDQADEEV